MAAADFTKNNNHSPYISIQVVQKTSLTLDLYLAKSPIVVLVTHHHNLDDVLCNPLPQVILETKAK